MEGCHDIIKHLSVLTGYNDMSLKIPIRLLRLEDERRQFDCLRSRPEDKHEPFSCHSKNPSQMIPQNGTLTPHTDSQYPQKTHLTLRPYPAHA
jgi:hypothetical protein